MQSFKFEYAAPSELSFDDFTVSVKMGFVKRQFQFANILHYYVLITKDYHVLYITYTDDAGKTKKAQLYSTPFAPSLTAAVQALKEKIPGKSLLHLDEKEAMATLKIANPKKWAPVVGFLLLWGICTICFLPGLRHYFDFGHANYTVAELQENTGAFSTKNVTVNGKLLDMAAEETVTSSKSHTTTHSTFVPFVSENWEEGQPITVVLKFKELSDEEFNSLDGTSFTGVIRNVWWEGLEKDKVEFFRNHFNLNVSDSVVLVEVTNQDTGNDLWALIAFVALTAFLLVIAFVVARKQRRG